MAGQQRRKGKGGRGESHTQWAHGRPHSPRCSRMPSHYDSALCARPLLSCQAFQKLLKPNASACRAPEGGGGAGRGRGGRGGLERGGEGGPEGPACTLHLTSNAWDLLLFTWQINKVICPPSICETHSPQTPGKALFLGNWLCDWEQQLRTVGVWQGRLTVCKSHQIRSGPSCPLLGEVWKLAF